MTDEKDEKDENPLAHLTNDQLVAAHSKSGANSHFLSEMLRRHMLLSADLGDGLSKLNRWLLAFTVVICLLTVVLVLVELGVMRRPPEHATDGAWVLWRTLQGDQNMKTWTIGLFFSLVVGSVVTWLFLKVLRCWLGASEPKPRLSAGSKGVPPWLTGMVERCFFTLLVALDVSGVPTAMVGWLAVKLATNWNHPDWKDKLDTRTYAFSALLGGLVSMLFALVGGLVCAKKLSLGI
jgi:hypothetical protein